MQTLMTTISPVTVPGWASRTSAYLSAVGPEWFSSRLGVDFRENNQPLEGPIKVLAINIHADVLAGPALHEASSKNDRELLIASC